MARLQLLVLLSPRSPGIHGRRVTREMLGLEQTVTYRYRCSRCQHENDLPDVVIMGFAASDGCKSDQMPPLTYPEYGGRSDHWDTAART